MFTQRRCSECECRNGEIRCEEAESCGQANKAGCPGPEYLCGKGESPRGKSSVGTILRNGKCSLSFFLLRSIYTDAMEGLGSVSGSVFGTGPLPGSLVSVINVGKCTEAHNSLARPTVGPDNCHLSAEQ